MPLIEGFSAEIYKTTTAKLGKLGSKLAFPDGRVFRYAYNGAVALAAGRLVQSVVPTSNHVNCTVATAGQAGDLTIEITLGATAVVANEYADGYIHVNDAGADTTTEGYLYRIKSHPAAAASGTLVLTLYEDSPVHIALTTNSQCSLTHNEFYGTIIQPSPPTSRAVGVAPTAVGANEYYWCQTAGPCAVLTDGTIAIAASVMPSNGVDGAVEAWALTEGTPNVEITPKIGEVMSVNATTEESLIKLMLE